MRLGVLAFLLAAAAEASAGEIADQCRADLDALPSFLAVNDAGAADRLKALGQAAFDAALGEARDRVQRVSRDEECVMVLRDYLQIYRRGHLAVAPLRSAAAGTGMPSPGASDPKAPSFRALANDTAVITLPTFDDRYASLIEQLVKEHIQELTSMPYLVIDVRRNNGGSDSSYAALLPLLAANVTRSMGTEFLSTPANIASSEAVCRLPEFASENCVAFMKPVIEAMKAAPAGTYALPQNESRGEPKSPGRVLANPRRIAVMIDRQCGSSCEEFVLLARQSFKVKTFGRPTYGALDYSNLRPHDLPSGKRRLFYATSRSTRLPWFRVDAAGIAPDVFFPPPRDDVGFDAEIDAARDVLESGQ